MPEKTKKQTLIFDFDGTIADTLHLSIEISNKLADEFHFKKIGPHEIGLLKDKSSQEIIKYLRIPMLKIPLILMRARQESNKKIKDMHLTEGLKEVLVKLHKERYFLGIFTSNSRQNVNQFLEKHKLNVFDFINSSSKLLGKSHGLEAIIRKNNFNREDIVYIADETRDVEAAKKAKIRIAAVCWGYNSRKALSLHKPSFLINSPKELLNIF